MKKKLKRRAEIREKIKDLKKRSDELLAEVREGKKKLDGDSRSKLEQIRADLETERAALEEVNREIDDQHLVSDLDSEFRALEASTEPERGTAKTTDQPIESIAPLGRHYRPDLRALRNAHPLFRDWATAGEFFQAVARHFVRGETDQRLQGFLDHRGPTAFGEAVDSDGGFLVPAQFVAELLQLQHQLGAILGRVRIIPMETRKVVFPAIDETSRKDGSRMGGIRVFWEGEGDAPNISKGRYRKVELELNKLTGATHASDQLLEDASALAAWIQMAFVEEMLFTKERAIFEGSGAGQPLGIKNSKALITVAKEGGQAADTIVFENIVNMRARLFARSRQNSVWLNNQDTEPQLHAMSLAVGTGGVPVWLPAGGLSGAPNDTLFGRPVIPVEYADTLGDKGDINLFDLSQYLFGQRGGIQTATSIHVRFLEGEQTFRFVERVDGGPWWTSALTPFKGTLTQSPFITLAARA